MEWLYLHAVVIVNEFMCEGGMAHHGCDVGFISDVFNFRKLVNFASE